MTLNELAGELEKAKKDQGGDIEVMIRLPGRMAHTPAKATMTYTTKRIFGAPRYEQVPVVLIEPADEE